MEWREIFDRRFDLRWLGSLGSLIHPRPLAISVAQDSTSRLPSSRDTI